MDDVIIIGVMDDVIIKGAAVQAGRPTMNIRLYLKAANLPKSTMTHQQPDVLARVSLKEMTYKTEVVRKCSNPSWTTSFAAQYDYGTQLLFAVDLFVVSAAGHANAGASAGIGNADHARGMKWIGRATFDVQDVLRSAHKVTARRLRNEGIVYAHIEIDSQPQMPPERRMLNLRLRADSLVHTHSRLRTSMPDTYFEISRRLSSGQWIAVYRSLPVSESVTPTWDEASIDLGSTTDLGDFCVMISVYKVTRTKCKEIGSFETTVQSLIDSRTTSARIAGYSRRPLHRNEAENAEGRNTFQIFRPAANRSVPSQVTGILTVVNASVENVNDVRSRSDMQIGNGHSRPADLPIQNDRKKAKVDSEVDDDEVDGLIPRIPSSFPEFDAMPLSEVRRVVEDKAFLDLFVEGTSRVTILRDLKQSIETSNAEAVRANLADEEIIVTLSSEVKTLEQDLKGKVQQYQNLYADVIAELLKAKKDALRESGDLAQRWIKGGCSDVSNFVERFIDVRQSYHMRAAKAERLAIDPPEGFWRKEGWMQVDPLTNEQFVEIASDFCSRHSFDEIPTAARNAYAIGVASGGGATSSSSSSSSSSIDGNGGSHRPSSGDKRLIYELTEEEQLQAAIQASMQDESDDEDNGDVEMTDATEGAKTKDVAVRHAAGAGDNEMGRYAFEREIVSVEVGDEPALGDLARVQIRMSDGRRLVRMFRGDDPVKLIYAFVAQSNNDAKAGRAFELKAKFPPQDLFANVDDGIKSCGLDGETINVIWK